MVALPAVEESRNCTGNCAAAGRKLLKIVALPAVPEEKLIIALPMFVTLAVPPCKTMPAPKKLIPPMVVGLMVKL